MTDNLTFDEFPRPTDEDWYETARDALKGAPFDKVLTTPTYEGLVLQPRYRQAEAADIAHQHTLPGNPPYVRGTHGASQPWHIAQAISYGCPADFNATLRHDLEQGQTAITIVLDAPTRFGLDPDQAQPGDVGTDGLSLANLDDVAQALDGIDLASIPMFIQAGTAALPLAALLVAYMRTQGQNPAKLAGCIENDPLGVLASDGKLPLSLDSAYDDMAQLSQWAVSNAPHLNMIAVHTTAYHNSGCHAVQELAFAVATGVDYIRAMQQRGLSIDDIATHIQFTFAIGSNFFMEIAKLRAARLLWAQIIAAFGGDETAQKMTLHAHTATHNKTAYDPHTNMLRTTIEALAGAVGGSASLHVAPFDEVIGPPDEFSRRIARNQQLILQQECNLSHLIDPAGGAWYVEYLTDWLAREAWASFQGIEAQGGMLAALQAGIPQSQVAEIAEQHADRLARRKDVLVGTNMYPNLGETPLDKQAIDDEALYQERATAIKDFRKHQNPVLYLTDDPAESAIKAAETGATLSQIAAMLHPDGGDIPTVTPLGIHRGAEPFEALRQAAETYASRTGSPPQIFLATMGPLHQHRARADFTTGFYEVGGFDILSNDGFATPEAAAGAALDSGAPVVVICSTDDTYPEIVPPLVKAIKADKPDTIIILAGYPQDQIDAHRATGVDDFIHLRANCYAMNYRLQQQIGVRV